MFERMMNYVKTPTPNEARVGKKYAFVVGTRPEAIKLAKVIALAAESGVVILTSQHEASFSQVDDLFGSAAIYRIPSETPAFLRHRGGEHPTDLRLFTEVVRLVSGLSTAFHDVNPDHVVVQGDTTSALAGAVAASLRGIEVSHVEAGLRSESLEDPYPEELFRRIIGQLAKNHFAPTELTKSNLVHENVPATDVYVVGNTVVDGLSEVIEQTPLRFESSTSRYVVVTLHRRQSRDMREEQLANLHELAGHYPETAFYLFLHPNPVVKAALEHFVASMDRPNVQLQHPLNRKSFLKLLRGCAYAISDSGGVQEEAPYFRKRVFIVRDFTERPEAKGPNGNVLVGRDGSRLVESVRNLERSGRLPFEMPYPYGSGNSSEQIWQIMARLDVRK